MRKPHRGRDKRGYHHGNLAEALVDAAVDLIRQFGPAGFSFADVTRAVGVSAAAPYRHFRDRDALMAEVARRGFSQFATLLAKAWDRGQPDPVTALKNVGKAYLSFAGAQPAYYAAMFDARLPSDMTQELRKASDQAFAVLREACEALIAEMPENRRPPALMMSLHVWAMAHGIASLFGGDARHPVPMAPEDLLEAGILIYLDGLTAGN